MGFNSQNGYLFKCMGFSKMVTLHYMPYFNCALVSICLKGSKLGVRVWYVNMAVFEGQFLDCERGMGKGLITTSSKKVKIIRTRGYTVSETQNEAVSKRLTFGL